MFHFHFLLLSINRRYYTFGTILLFSEPAASRFLLTSLNPPSSMNAASEPRTTASVTKAPITPPITGDIPWPLLVLVDTPLLYVAQTPVETPHFVHHCSVVLMANLLMLVWKSFHEMAFELPPKSGYSVKSLVKLEEPLLNKNLTCRSSVEVGNPPDTSAVVKSSNAMELAKSGTPVKFVFALGRSARPKNERKVA